MFVHSAFSSHGGEITEGEPFSMRSIRDGGVVAIVVAAISEESIR
jgi:hypothetical protein